MTPLLASASLLKHSVPAIPNLFWFPKGCSLPSTCCSLCLEHSFLTSSMAKFHSSYRGLRLDVTSYMKSTRLTSSQIGQESLLDSRGSHGLPPSLQRDSGSVYQGHTSPQQACNKYWRSEIFRERGEPGVVREPQGRGGGPGWGQHLKEHSKNSSSWASLAALVGNELLITRSHTRRCQTLPPAAPLLHPQGASAKAHPPSSLCPAPSAPSCSMGLALPPLVKKAAQRVWAKGSQGCSHSFGQPSSFLKRPREP